MSPRSFVVGFAFVIFACLARLLAMLLLVSLADVWDIKAGRVIIVAILGDYWGIQRHLLLLLVLLLLCFSRRRKRTLHVWSGLRIERQREGERDKTREGGCEGGGRRKRVKQDKMNIVTCHY